MARITGVGGIFFTSPDPKNLSTWYREVLGIEVQDWGGSLLRYDAPNHPPFVAWNPFPEKADYFAPSTRPFMINFAVDDMDGFVSRVEAMGVAIFARDDESPFGRFAWLLDPDGTKIELWQPKKPAA
ncbi:MAG: VOC family protein [Alphaproteobacteria bacterium]|nr:VOC family protein [Alphaproteobacteria bacterium]